MKFALLIYQGTTPLPGSDSWNALPQEEQKAIYAEYAAFSKTPGLEPGLPLGLPGAARTVRMQEGKIQVKPGTYLPEGIGGYCIVDVGNMEAAVAIAGLVPAARLGGAVEVRPAEQYW